MPRFFVEPEMIEAGCAKIVGDDARHIARALRMAEGDDVVICDGVGNEYDATLSKIRDELCIADISEKREGCGESPVEVTLYMGYPKSDKLEVVVQKATELGAVGIIPFESSRCIKKQKAEKAQKTTERLSRIAYEAAKQCGRSRLPLVTESVDISELPSHFSRYDAVLFCYEGADATDSLKKRFDEIKDAKKIAVIVGSEGGFSEAEAELLVSGGALPVTLGKRILRCETAPSFILSAVSFQFEVQ